MVRLSLEEKNLIYRDTPDNFFVYETTELFIIQECIDKFNSEIRWDMMFKISDAIKRLENGNKFYVGYYNKEIFGYCWVRKDKECFNIFNVFSKKTDYKRYYGATDLLYWVIKNYTYGNVCADVDDWNIKSLNVFNKLGFIEYL